MQLKQAVALLLVALLVVNTVVAESPYRFFEWNVTYGTISPLGVPQQGILINGQFPGPDIISVTNDNVIVNVFNRLDEPFLLSWNGVQNRRNSFEDGVWGTTCPIPPGKNFTYTLQMKDQIGSFYYFPSLGFHKAAGGFGSIRIFSGPYVPVPLPAYSGDFIVLIGDWYKTNHTNLRAILDRGHKLPFPDGILINGRGPNGASFTVEQGNTYRLRISNVGLENSLNFRIEGHNMTLVEVEGTHTMQETYSSLDVHVGQSYSVLITADKAPKDYYIVVSSRFTSKVLTTTGVLHYSNSNTPVSGPLPSGPTIEVGWSLYQARSIRINLTANGPRPNPQGSYHYGMINTSRTIRLATSAGQVNRQQRYAVNSVSFEPTDTPLKLADYFKIGGFRPGNIPDAPTGGGIHLDTSVLQTDYRTFIEIVFENKERIVQSWHIAGYNFWVVGMDGGRWTPASRNQYNLRDAVSRCTTQVYPRSWTAIYIALDNVGMWNLRSEFWARRYLGQQLYMRVRAENPTGYTSSDLEAMPVLSTASKNVRLSSPYRVGPPRSLSPTLDEFAVDTSAIGLREGASPSHPALDYGLNRVRGRDDERSERQRILPDDANQHPDIPVKSSMNKGIDRNGLGDRLAVKMWQHTEEEEFNWEDMSPTLADQSPFNDLSTSVRHPQSIRMRPGVDSQHTVPLLPENVPQLSQRHLTGEGSGISSATGESKHPLISSLAADGHTWRPPYVPPRMNPTFDSSVQDIRVATGRAPGVPWPPTNVHNTQSLASKPAVLPHNHIRSPFEVKNASNSVVNHSLDSLDMASTQAELSKTAGKPIHCKAAVARKAGEPLVIEEIIVAPPKSREVRLKIICTSLCHIDVTFWKLKICNFTRIKEFPGCFLRILGHEAFGVVESVGEDVRGLEEGDSVVPIFLPDCTECLDYCTSKKSNNCSKFQFKISPWMLRDGTSRFTTVDGETLYHFPSVSSFTEYTVVDIANVKKIDPCVPLNRACLFSCGVSTDELRSRCCPENRNVEPGSTVVIFGLGAIGLAVAEGARISGATRSIGVDINSDKLEIGRQFGVTDFVNSNSYEDKPISQVINETTNGGADYCFECVGLGTLVQEAYACCRKGRGKTIVLGVDKPGAELTFKSFDVLHSGKTLMGSLFGSLKPKSDIPLVKRYLDKELQLDNL
ncbi:hypothetical protein K7X08_027504 [Anisodus acutangulus]|uniref:Uncharacterized protein n=1 Tax=Anisodus acutangulus TaxID=402998 RepID=A0A9Q1RL21_9SOLA|nr:hypothetical protein K7X08_027504 [Anisodus acutangulus]